VRFECESCGESAHLIVGFSELTIGIRGRPGTTEFERTDALEDFAREYSSKWSSNGVRISYGDRRWTVHASDE
jgi:hypothetical protein